MNRKQRRAALRQTPPAIGGRAGAPGDPVSQLFAEAVRCQQQNQLADATRLYKRLLAVKPDHAEASNNLGAVLVAQGKLSEASARFAHSLALMPQLFEQFSGVFGALVAVLPPIGEAIRRTFTAWPTRLTVEQLFGSAGLSAIIDDPLLLCILQSAPVRNFELELLLTSLRAALLHAAADASRPVTEPELAFYCVLAKQYFINEYVFATTPDEDAQHTRLIAAVGEAIASGAAIAPISLAAIAMYQPLRTLAAAASLLERTWPPALEAVLTQQIREPMEEQQLRATMPRLTPIEDDVSQRVRRQYEENPYPRWVTAAAGVQPIALDAHLRNKFPDVVFAPLGKTEAVDILVAGCGTGMEAVNVAQGYLGARVLAVDLSLSSLCYAKRHTPPPFSQRIEYAQADILKLPSIGRSFDMIDVCGVLHHMADPLEAWRILLGLLRPGGIMHLGLYSELGRRDVVAARAFIAERGYTPSVVDIRRCRQDLLATPLGSISRFNDFYTTSECRDLLFHVQESRMTLPAIKAFIEAQRLKFIGFDFTDMATHKFRELFAKAGRPMTDLDYWHTVETQYPDTFSSMYNFWVQKPGA
jgi:2-polyprenyl-3-methyl-5-hydroxy-6-metoxy-1,4-benzoquinol methylase